MHVLMPASLLTTQECKLCRTPCTKRIWESSISVSLAMPRGVTTLVNAFPVTDASDRRGIFRLQLRHLWTQWTRRDESGSAPSALFQCDEFLCVMVQVAKGIQVNRMHSRVWCKLPFENRSDHENFIIFAD